MKKKNAITFIFMLCLCLSAEDKKDIFYSEAQIAKKNNNEQREKILLKKSILKDPVPYSEIAVWKLLELELGNKKSDKKKEEYLLEELKKGGVPFTVALRMFYFVSFSPPHISTQKILSEQKKSQDLRIQFLAFYSMAIYHIKMKNYYAALDEINNARRIYHMLCTKKDGTISLPLSMKEVNTKRAEIISALKGKSEKMVLDSIRTAYEKRNHQTVKKDAEFFLENFKQSDFVTEVEGLLVLSEVMLWKSKEPTVLQVKLEKKLLAHARKYPGTSEEGRIWIQIGDLRYLNPKVSLNNVCDAWENGLSVYLQQDNFSPKILSECWFRLAVLAHFQRNYKLASERYQKAILEYPELVEFYNLPNLCGHLKEDADMKRSPFCSAHPWLEPPEYKTPADRQIFIVYAAFRAGNRDFAKKFLHRNLSVAALIDSDKFKDQQLRYDFLQMLVNTMDLRANWKKYTDQMLRSIRKNQKNPLVPHILYEISALMSRSGTFSKDEVQKILVEIVNEYRESYAAEKALNSLVFLAECNKNYSQALKLGNLFLKRYPDSSLKQDVIRRIINLQSKQEFSEGQK